MNQGRFRLPGRKLPKKHFTAKDAKVAKERIKPKRIGSGLGCRGKFCCYGVPSPSQAQGRDCTKLSNLHQSIPPLPVLAEMLHYALAVYRSNFWIGLRYEFGGFNLCQLEQFAIAQNICNAQPGHARLLGAKEFAGAAQFKIELGNFKTILSADHGIQTALCFWRNFAASH